MEDGYDEESFLSFAVRVWIGLMLHESSITLSLARVVLSSHLDCRETTKMRFVALVSGGKDSIYSTLECIRNGHELVACVHLGRPESVQEESYMYQTAASEVVRTQVEDCLGVPLLFHQRVGTSINTSLVYDGNEEEENSSLDEVEDLYIALRQAKQQFENIEAVSSGAILSTYQRVRIENVCSRLGLTSLSYLWRLLPQKELLQKMLQDGMEAVVVRAACPPGLIPRKHLNKTLRFLWDSGLLERLHQRYQFHVCGEGGEYESLVIDSPLYQKKLVLDEVEIEESDDGVGDLKILKCHAEDKTDDDIPIIWSPSAGITETDATTSAGPEPVDDDSRTPNASDELVLPRMVHLPRVQCGTGGLFHVSEIMASMAASQENASESELAVQEARDILSILRKTLEQNGANAKDVLFVHLYLSEISHFAAINAHYQDFFGTVLPPSRSCVAVGKSVLPGGRRVLLDCLVQPGSGEYMRCSSNTAMSNAYALAAHATKTSKLREVLHVQSISHWAPVCVGPYSQVNTLRSGLHFMAGQIGLLPATMQLHPTWKMQLNQCWQNVAAVLDALDGGSLKEQLISGMIYVSPLVHDEKDSLDSIQSTTKRIITENGNLIAGRIDALVDNTELFGGYEDEGTWQEMKAQQQDDVNESEELSCPILVVSIPEMPKGAQVEVEVIAATKSAATSLEISTSQYSTACVPSKNMIPDGWDTGHTFATENPSVNEGFHIHASVCFLGHQNTAVALVSASVDQGKSEIDVQTIDLLSSMLSALTKVLAKGRTGLVSKDAMHLRLFHTATRRVASGTLEANEDGLHIRSAFQSAVAKWGDDAALPATSVVPVHTINILNSTPSASGGGQILLAVQALLVDPVHTETDIWIRKDREYTT
jgi:diphthine-ammonia ligase